MTDAPEQLKPKAPAHTDSKLDFPTVMGAPADRKEVPAQTSFAPPANDTSAPYLPHVDLVKDFKSGDPKNPTVAFIDEFKHPLTVVTGMDPNKPMPGPSHGDISATAAEQSDKFNVLRLQMEGEKAIGLRTDFSPYLNDVLKKIDSGELHLGKGDVVNISMGNNVIKDASGRPIPNTGDPTFAQASEILGFKVSPNTLGAQRDAILKRLTDIAADPDPAKADNAAWAKSVIDTNSAIDKLQAKGIEVMHAAGEDNRPGDAPDQMRFSWDFLKADKQITGDLSHIGKAAERTDLTTDSPVTFKSVYKGVNFLDPTPVKDQLGQYKLEGANVVFDAKNYGGLNTSSQFLYTTKDGRVGRLDRAPEQTKELDPHPVVPNGKNFKIGQFSPAGPADPPADGLHPIKGKAVPFKLAKVKVDNSGIDKKLAGTWVGVVAGTSYGNLVELQREWPDLYSKKNQE